MNIDFIKWMCDKAEGFDVSYISFDSPAKMNNGFYVNTPHDSFKIDQNTPLWRNVYDPLLLQRAIEGVNENTCMFIEQHCDHIKTYRPTDVRKTFYFMFDDCGGIDQTKESALMYIYEQEKENGR